MFVGHGLVAFAIAASVAARRGWPVERALAVGLVAGLFGALPDVDMLYAAVGLVGGLEGFVATSDAFWDVANEVHRGATHSLVVGALAAVGFTGWHARDDLRVGALGVVVLLGLVAMVTAVGGPVPGAVAAAFVLGGVGVVTLAERFELGTGVVFGAATLGLVSHPFGDLLAGPAPALLYPFDVGVLAGGVTLHPDPTVHLLGAFFLELATVWAALAVLTHLRGRRLRHHVSPRAALGLAYVGAVFVIPAPTVEVASPFVFTVLAVGLLGVPLQSPRSRDGRIVDRHAITTALAAVTLAAFAYAGAYVIGLS
ncbi:MAG: metal-dependent hydrolase [Haloarculaceae archaeon]